MIKTEYWNWLEVSDMKEEMEGGFRVCVNWHRYPNTWFLHVQYWAQISQDLHKLAGDVISPRSSKSWSKTVRLHVSCLSSIFSCYFRYKMDVNQFEHSTAEEPRPTLPVACSSQYRLVVPNVYWDCRVPCQMLVAITTCRAESVSSCVWWYPFFFCACYEHVHKTKACHIWCANWFNSLVS